jgi:hypothetical protein
LALSLLGWIISLKQWKVFNVINDYVIIRCIRPIWKIPFSN